MQQGNAEKLGLKTVHYISLFLICWNITIHRLLSICCTLLSIFYC